MKRVSIEALESAAWAERKLIEFDHEQGIAVLMVKGQTFYADLPPDVPVAGVAPVRVAAGEASS